MDEREINSATAYMDMVRNHRERGFDEGCKAMREVYTCHESLPCFNFPPNPYKIKEKNKTLIDVKDIDYGINPL